MIKLIKNLFKKKCKHERKSIIFICYQNRFVKYKCNICGEEIYEDL